MSALTAASPQITSLQKPSPGPRKRKPIHSSLCPADSPKLPLKKRLYTEHKDDEAQSEDVVEISRISATCGESTKSKDALHTPDQPVDFSLPNRIRAKNTPSKTSVKSEIAESHSPSDTTAASISPCNSDKTDDLKPVDLSGEYKKNNLPNSAKPEQHQFLSAAFTHQCSPQTFLEALRLSGRLNSSIPLFPPAMGCLPLPLAGNTLSCLPGNFRSSSGTGSLFPSPGPLFPSGPDLNLLNSLGASAPSVNKQNWQKAVESEKKLSKERFSDAEENSGNASPEGTFVINPATGNKVRKNYKNMTRERRVEANARERTRVHTIGSAFDNIRKLVPCLAPDQKLSKLSILRIACKYIMLLAAMNGLDYSPDQRGYTVEECVELLNDTVIAESKAKRSDR